MEHFNVSFRPDNKEISIHAGATLLEAGAQAGIILNTACGGKGICKKCVVNIEPDGRAVLACQYHIHGNLAVTIPQNSRYFEQKILAHGIDRQIEVNPTVCKKHLKISSRDPLEVEAMLKKTFANHRVKMGEKVGWQLAILDSQAPEKGVTVVCRLEADLHGCASFEAGYTAICLEEGDTTHNIFGVAVDLGTTTIVAKLIDITDGRCKATQATINPQSRYGDDVISRIHYAQSDANLTELHELVINCLNQMVTGLCRRTSVDANHIYEMCVVGNTTMNHIFLKLPVTQLGQAPYEAFSLEAQDLTAEQLALGINAAGNVHTVENIAGFVGSDTTAVSLAADMNSANDVTLAVDIGTNGELVLAAGDKLYAASCAAGPALEGAGIECGGRAVEGAIQAVVITDGDIDLDVIGGGPARSICGSGIIDAVAVLLDLGILDASGRFVQRKKLDECLPGPLLSRVIEHNGQGAFVLAENESSGGQKVILTQEDIRQVQLAKGAIRAGITLLLKKTGLEDSDIQRVMLAGAFGNYIRPKSAVRIGLLPDVPLERIHFIGNAASSGAQMILLSRDCRALACELARKIEYVEIAHEAEFQSVFPEAMGF